MFFNSKKSLKEKNSGAISLMTVLILSGILVEIAAIGLTNSFLSGEKGLGLRASHIATYAARSGVEDMLLHIIRDKSYVPSSNPYTLNVSGGSASVLVTRTLPDASTIQYVVASTGSSGSKRIKMTLTTVLLDADGSISTSSLVESGL